MKVNIACLQMVSDPYNWDYNIEKATSMIIYASKKGANICLLPEAFIPGYSLTANNFRQAEKLDGPTVSTLSALSKKLQIYITGSIIEKTDKDFYNTMIFLGPDGLLGTYRKNFVASFENKYWKRGEKGSIIETEFGKIGLGICADMHYPKLWKQYVGKVNMILICSAWPDVAEKINNKLAKHEMELCKGLPVQISKVFHSSLKASKCSSWS